MLKFEDVYREHRSFVFRQCSRLVKGADNAEDLTQEVFISVLRNLHRFDGRSKVQTWLYRIAFNTFLMSVRGKRAQTVRLAVEPCMEFHPVRDLAVREALSHMPARDREILVRHFVNGETYTEIADTEPIGTLKSRCTRARRRFVEVFGAQ